MSYREYTVKHFPLLLGVVNLCGQLNSGKTWLSVFATDPTTICYIHTCVLSYADKCDFGHFFSIYKMGTADVTGMWTV